MSTMRIVTPNGAIKEVEKVCFMVEKRFKFNNHERRAVEEAESLAEKPTAVSLTFASSNAMFGVFGNDLFIGNLKPETVVEIQQSLLKDGFYDFGGMKYQRVKDFRWSWKDHHNKQFRNRTGKTGKESFADRCRCTGKSYGKSWGTGAGQTGNHACHHYVKYYQ